MIMDIQTKRKNDIMIISLNGELTIYNARLVVNYIHPILEQYKKVAIDLKNVSEVDTAGMQALIFLKRESKYRKVKLKMINHTEPIIKVMNLLGLVGFFADKIKITPELKKKYNFKYGI